MAVVAIALSSTTGGAVHDPLELSVSLRWLGARESLRVGEIDEQRLLSTYALGLGLSYFALTIDGAEGALRGQAELALAWRPGPGNAVLGAGHTFAWVWPLSELWSVSVGLRLGLWIDTTQTWHSAFEVSLPLGARCGFVELVLAPALVGPLGTDAQDGFAGTRSRSMALAPSVFNVSLRLHLFEL
ncbi:MAG: hypothetical protein IT384_18485 [Deltaproteobacteria bacterium]|nr:hypothetical protein [Deltaproteobacteria bacterium]